MDTSRISAPLMVQAYSMYKKAYADMQRTEDFTRPAAVDYVTENFQHYHNQLMRDGQMEIRNGVARVYLPALQSHTRFPNLPRYTLDTDRNVYIHRDGNNWEQIDFIGHLHVHEIKLRVDSEGNYWGPPVFYEHMPAVKYCKNC